MADEKSNPPLPGQPRSNLVEGERFGTGFTEADVRNSDLTYATGDCVGFLAAENTTAPAGFERLDRSVWKCFGWLDVAGYTFKNTETTKDIGAAGTLSAIRTVITGGVKEIAFIALESMNPYVRAMYDDVPVSDLLPTTARTDVACTAAKGAVIILDVAATAADVGSIVIGPGIPLGAVVQTASVGVSITLDANHATTAAITSPSVVKVGGNQVSYIFPETPSGNRYALIFDTLDGDQKVRAYAPSGMVTTRGDDVYTQADTENLSLTTTLYPASIGGVRGTLKRYSSYGGTDLSSYT